MEDTLGDRIKSYENVCNYRLTNRIPLIIRLDGKSFHSWVKKSNCSKPFDNDLITLMQNTTKYLCENISGCILGYCQSDEISLLLINSQNINTQPWFDNRIQKICSVSSSLATYYFNQNNNKEKKVPAFFDSRTFLISEQDIINYFIWRERDCIRNSITLLAQSLYSHKFLMNKNSDEKLKLCKEKNVDWETQSPAFKRGSCIYKVMSSEPLINKRNGEKTYRKKFIIDSNIPFIEHNKDCFIANILSENGINIF